MKITPTTVIDFKQAQPEDLPVVLEILAETAVWLQAKGLDFPTAIVLEPQIAAAITQGELYTVGIVKNRFGVVQFGWHDPLWPDDNLAGYLTMIAVRNEMHGQKLGETMLIWTLLKAKRAKKSFLRLSCAVENGRLRHYFEDQEFVFQREQIQNNSIIALYEKAI